MDRIEGSISISDSINKILAKTNNIHVKVIKWPVYATVGCVVLLTSPIIYLYFMYVIVDLRKKINEISAQVNIISTQDLIELDEALTKLLSNSKSNKTSNRSVLLTPIYSPVILLLQSLNDLHNKVKDQIEDDMDSLSHGWDEVLPFGVIPEEAQI